MDVRGVASVIPSVEDYRFDPIDPVVVRDPYTAYARLRAHAPVHWNPKGFWFVSRFEDVHACLNDTRFSNRPAPFALVHARNKDRFFAADVANNLMAFQDAPEHPPLRGWVARCFAQRVNRMEPRLSQIAQECAADLPGAGAFEAVADFAIPFASRAICAVLGFPERDAPQVANWSMDFFKLFHAIPDKAEFEHLNGRLKEFRSYVVALQDRAHACHTSGLLPELLKAAPPNTEREVIADNIMLLAADGVGNVQAGLANCLAVLLRQPELPEQFFTTPRDRARVIDECLRLESPGQYQGRITLQDVEISGRIIRAHSIVLLGLASANRDEQAFPAPDTFDPERTRPQHLAFGSGAHMCMGNVLVRKEIGAALHSLFTGCRRLRLLEPSLEWLARPGHRWLARLMIQVDRS